MAKHQIHPLPSDKIFLELPRVYEDVPTEVLKEVLEALQRLTDEVDQYESVAERRLLDYYKSGMEALALTLRFHHEKTIAKASIQVLAELTLRVYLSGEDGLYFMHQYANENSSIFSGFDTQAVVHLATVWENQLSE